MKKSYLFLAATAILAFASCSENTYLGEQEGPNGSSGAITFGFDVPNATRGEKTGEQAATALNNQFIVWGEKNESGGTAVTVPSANIVFPNYQVNWVNLPYSTTSNTNGWEYVGYTHSNTTSTDDYQTNITPHLSVAQEIKYWDERATNYVFTAVSAQQSDIKTGKVQIAKILSGTDKYAKGYTITTSGADFTKLYVADRVELTTKTSPVSLTFRNVLSQIRVGIYETIPGYDISNIRFFVNTSGDSPVQTAPAEASSTPAFGAVCPNVKASGNPTLTVTYGDGTTFTENQPIITSDATSSSNLILGTNINNVNTSATLGKEATTPTWDTGSGTFTAVFPQINNTSNLSLKCNYTLYNSSSGETILIEGKTATIPYQYLQWKPNYKYSYLFKITDDELNPITFDAVVIEAEDGEAEYITTVTQPSITTFGILSDKYSFEKNEYENGTDIYATITENGSVVAPTVGSNVNVYVATATDGFLITEASVAESIAHSTASPKVTCTLINDNSSTYFTAVPARATDGVPREDGGYISTSVSLTANPAPSTWPTGYYSDERCTTAAPSEYANGTYYQKWTDALKLTGVKNPNTPTYYVIEYINGTNKTYKVIKVVTTPAP